MSANIESHPTKLASHVQVGENVASACSGRVAIAGDAFHAPMVGIPVDAADR
jgi:hypothetical protein